MRSHRITSTTAALALGFALSVLPLAGCEREGPAERAGEQVDETADKAKDALGRQGPAEDAGEDVDEALDND